MIRIGVVGASGRTGRFVLQALRESDSCVLQAAVVSPRSPQRGHVVEGSAVVYSDSLEALRSCDVVIEFSNPTVSVSVAQQCAEWGIPALLASTGHSREQMVDIKQCAERVAVGLASNTSLGAAVLSVLARQAKQLLGPAFDIEVMEIHHKMKKDAPSGTARSLIQEIEYGSQVVFGREGTRAEGEIGVVSLRGGDVVGDHTVYFLGHGERIELSHRVSTREVFGRGALALAASLVGRPSGCYSAEDLLAGSKTSKT